MTSITLRAGPRALEHIRENGLQQSSFSMMAGASGGPKWFILYGLDRYLFGEFFAGRHEPLLTVGSSAGAWRLACFGQDDPVAAIDRLAWRYARQQYSQKPDCQEVSSEARRLLDYVLGDTGAREIAHNPVIRVNILANRCRRLTRSDRQLLLSCGLLLCGLGNILSRKTLPLFFERVIFYNQRSADNVFRLGDMPTSHIPLSEQNVAPALMATGSIPLIMEGVRGICGADGAVFRDGGIIDYHLNLPFSAAPGLVLYPHFYSTVIPGWFDKMLPWRKADARNFDNVLLVSPSAEFVARLPFGKIPDRRDFETMDYSTRLAYWETVLSESHRMADDFSQLVETGTAAELVQPLQMHRRIHD